MQKNWYAVYTAPRAEKKVSERFTQQNIEHYLPLRTTVRIWSDRKKKVTAPVIHGYIFVNIEATQFQKVLGIYGACAFIRENNKPVAIPDEQIQRLKFMVENTDQDVEFSNSDLQIGETVEVVKGDLNGLMGELVQINGKYKVAIRIEKLGCALVEVSLSSIQRI